MLKLSEKQPCKGEAYTYYFSQSADVLNFGQLGVTTLYLSGLCLLASQLNLMVSMGEGSLERTL